VRNRPEQVTRTDSRTGKGAILARNGAVDAARGLLILYIIVVIHGLFWLNLLPQAISSWLLFAMPAIFVVSGYSYALYERSRADQGENQWRASYYFAFLLHRLIRILLPYFVYALGCVILITALAAIGEAPSYAAADLLPAWIDPFRFGRNYSVAMLNWHLWFLPMFLIVSAMLPLATRIKPFKNPAIWILLIVAVGAEFLLAQVRFPNEQLFKEVVFYLSMALAGYYLAQARDYFSPSKLGMVAGLSLAMLAVLIWASGDSRSLNMQLNKFPPNHLFLLFSCFWMALILLITSQSTGWSRLGDRLARSWWLKPFVLHGYSIYLWQGMGYVLAVLIGRKLGWSYLAIWPLAVGFTIGLGLIAAPVERIRWRRRVK
jgi:peptidoglycan/LPS O-acetylase OafA/YrhL